MLTDKEQIDCILFHWWLEENGLLDEWFKCLEGVKHVR